MLLCIPSFPKKFIIYQRSFNKKFKCKIFTDYIILLMIYKIFFPIKIPILFNYVIKNKIYFHTTHMEAHCQLLIFHRSSQIINSDTFTRYKTKEWNPNRHSSITKEGILLLHSRRGFHAATHPFPQSHTAGQTMGWLHWQ